MKIRKIFIISSIVSIFIIIFSTSSFAEYYFVGNTAECNKNNNNNKIYKDSGAFYQSQYNYNKYSYNKYNYNNNTYNLDLITGDDDPYVYPGMNIDE